MKQLLEGRFFEGKKIRFWPFSKYFTNSTLNKIWIINEKTYVYVRFSLVRLDSIT